MERKEIGFEIKTLDNLILRLIIKLSQANAALAETTQMQVMIIGYMHDNPDKEIFQRDLENHFKIRRSTVTNIVALMEKKGLIVREGVARDARLKKLALTPKAAEIHRESRKVAEQAEARLRSGLTPEETETFFDIIQKIKGAIL